MSYPQMIECARCGRQLLHDGSIAGHTVACPSCNGDIAVPADPRWHTDPQRQLCDQNLALEGAIAGQAPVQATGRVGGLSFYFRAKWDNWTFTVSLHPEVDASNIDPPTERNGFFQCGECRGYFLGGDFKNASYMRYDTAEAIILCCARQVLDALNNEKPGNS